jgi:ribosomal protein L40E
MISMSVWIFFFLFSSAVSATDATYRLSATLRKEVKLSDEIEFDMFLSSSVNLVTPEKADLGENITCELTLNPATVMFFLEIPSLNRTYATESEIPLEELKPITVFEGITIVFDVSPSAELFVYGPATSNQTHLKWEEFLGKQSFEANVFQNVSGKEELTLVSDFYLNTQISIYVDLQNYTLEIVNHPLPQLEMSPRIIDVIEIQPKPTLIDFLRNPVNLAALIALIVLIVIALILIKKKKKSKQTKKGSSTFPETFDQAITKERIDNSEHIFCMYCGEQLPVEATFCRRCGKKMINEKG